MEAVLKAAVLHERPVYTLGVGNVLATALRVAYDCIPPRRWHACWRLGYGRLGYGRLGRRLHALCRDLELLANIDFVGILEPIGLGNGLDSGTIPLSDDLYVFAALDDNDFRAGIGTAT
jgi:hypothetical protein